MATTYRIQFNNVEEQLIEGTLTDETGDLDIIDIEGAEDAIRIVSQDNDESKYSPIKAKKCIFKFLNSQNVNLRTFATGEDNKWLATVKINSLTVFVGHLEQGDIEEPFQYQENQIVTLTATDGLGVLKTHRLEDIYNVWTPGATNENRIIDYIAACLGVTGLRLKINVINNLREEDNDDISDTATYGNIYATLFLSIKTLEDQKIGTYINSYDVLEKILGHDCYLTQAKGEWWIIRVKELRCDFNMIKTVFDFDGTALSFGALNYEHSIGLKDINNTPMGTPDALSFFSQDKTILSILRPVKYVSLVYNYDNPFEVLCNEAFQRGDFIADLPDEVDGDGHTLQVKSYDWDCWEYDKEEPPTTQDSDAYIKVRYLAGLEKERYVHMEPTAADDTYYYKSLQKIPVGLGDKMKINYAVRWGTDLGGAKPYSTQDLWIRLYGDDGSFWNFGFFPPNVGFKWWLSNSVWSTQVADRGLFVDDTIDMVNWNNTTIEISPMPVSGKLELLLLNKDQPSSQSKEFGSLDVEYIPYINGSYNIFSSQTDISTRDGIYFSAIEDEVFIANAPRPIFKGALLKFNGTDFVIVDRFYEGQEYDQTSGPDHLATYGELRVRAYHQQFRNGDELYRATCQGLGEGILDGDGLDDHPDIIHRYFNRDIEPTTNNQGFQLVSQDVDLRNCEWTGTLIKNFDIGIGFVLDTYTFNYGAPGGQISGGGTGGGVGINSAVITADNGLHIDPANNVRLGGDLVEDTSVGPNGFNTTWTNVATIQDSGVVGIGKFSGFGANKLETNLAIDGLNALLVSQSTDVSHAVIASIGNVNSAQAEGINISTSGSGGKAAFFNSSGGNAVALSALVDDASSLAVFLRILSSITNSVLTIMQIVRNSTGTAANGIGVGIDFFIEADDNNIYISNQIISKWTTAANATRKSQMKLTGALSGASVDLITLNADGSIQLRPITATEASAITPAEGMMVFVSSTNGTFTQIGFWGYENGTWNKL